MFRDGDIILTQHQLIFYCFGYEHFPNRIIAFLKYVPDSLCKFFQVEWLNEIWIFNGNVMRRPKRLYSPENYSRIIDGLKKICKKYVLNHPTLNKDIVAIDKQLIRRVYDPRTQLKKLLKRKNLDPLQENALCLIKTLSEASRVSIDKFGIHGSICIGMHKKNSDIDIAVYGGKNFLKVKNAIRKLEKQGEITVKRDNWIESRRENAGFFRNTKFVVNAIRDDEEISKIHRIYCPIKHVKFIARISQNEESFFRPAIYIIDKYIPLSEESEFSEIPRQIVTMIGEHRGILNKRELVFCRGMLEKVYENKETFTQVVIGTGRGEEYLCPLL